MMVKVKLENELLVFFQDNDVMTVLGSEEEEGHAAGKDDEQV